MTADLIVFYRLLLAVILVGLAGCAAAPVDRETALPLERAEVEPAQQWWAFRFVVDWPDGEEEPAWEVDLMLAHRILAPVMAQELTRLPLWRFHRRAARDGAGHRFSLIFYSSEATYQSLLSQLERSSLLKALLQDGTLLAMHHGNATGELPERIGATSDGSWDVAVQRSWPHFAMGVSRTWLELIDQLSGEGTGDDPGALRGHYREVREELVTLWRGHGQHAFLHHLGALFGYQPIIFSEQRLLRF